MKAFLKFSENKLENIEVKDFKEFIKYHKSYRIGIIPETRKPIYKK